MNIGLITYQIEKSPGGVGVLVQNLVENIIQLDKQNTYYLLHYMKSNNKIYGKNEILYRYYRYLPAMFSDSWYLYKHSDRFDVVHRFSPGGFIFKVKSKIVIGVNDLFLYKAYPFNRSSKIYLGRALNRSSLMKADAIIAISQFTKEEILDTFPVDEKKVHVVYCAPNNLIKRSEMGKDMVSSKYGTASKYILFVSTIEPRKNLLNLIRAYEILRERYFIDESLVVVGKKGWGYEKTLTYIERSPSKNSIKLIGYVPTTDLGSLYSHASLFVYPSFMEGFGIPPLEAMKCGCPTLTSNTSSLPEVIGYPDMMFDPYDVNEIANKCFAILKDPKVRNDNIEKGLKNVKRFSWRKSAEQIINIYHALQ
ncbi:MAG: glycosyltransferase family 4 protein [Deltaproteobacteria bacterium]|nr:MAG: glycosyltransferase family 4 protein [Deltaproteobacteria bacterium]